MDRPDGVSEIVWLRSALSDAGVAGAHHLAMFTAIPFVSELDEESAAPILLKALPSLREPWMVAAVIRHLGKRRADPERFAILLATYRRWLPTDESVCDVIGAALIAAAVPSDARHVSEVLDLMGDASRRCAQRSIVADLWRLRHDGRVIPMLRDLCADEAVCDQAMPALRRAIGNDAAQPFLEHLRDSTTSDRVRGYALVQERMASNNLRTRHAGP